MVREEGIMIMKKLSSIALVGIAIVLAAAAFSRAAASPGAHGFSGHPPSEIESNHGFEGHHGFDGRRNFDRRSHGGVFIGVPFGWAPVYPDYYPPALHVRASGSGLLVLLPELRSVLPNSAKLSRGMGPGASAGIGDKPLKG